jgi:hypothetical protein
MAKQIPCAGKIVAVFTPTTRPAGIDQRASGVAGVERGVGLDDVVDQTSGIRTQRASQRTDHTCRNRGLESIRAAESDHQLSDTKLLRVAECGGSETRFIDSNDSQVARRIITNCGRGHAATVGQSDFDSPRIVHHVAVSQDQAIGSEDEARASAAPFARLARAGMARGLMHFDIHDRRADALNCAGNSARIGVEEQIIAVRNYRGWCVAGKLLRKIPANMFEVHAP